MFEPLEARNLLSAVAMCQDDTDDTTDEVASETAALAADLFSALDAGSTTATAYDLGALGATRSLAGSVGGTDPRDVLRFTLGGQSTVNLALSGLTADIDLYLYNAAGQLIGSSTNSGAASESISSALGAGTYYILAAPWGRAVSRYTLTVGATATQPTTPTTPTTNPTTPSTPVAAFPDVAYYGGTNEWNLNSINAPESWAQGYTGQGVVVAVVDTGVDVNHPDLMSQLWVNADEIAGNGIDDDRNGYVDDVSGWDFATGDNNPDDGNGHGTHVAGTIAADNNGFGATGVAPGATIMPVRVLGSNGSGTAAAVAAGIRYAAANGADIINLSLGGGFSSIILSAIQYAMSLDVLVVAAAGNESAATPGYPARFSASLANVISVGAYASSGAIASFSNDVGTSGAVQVDAPGVGVYSTYVDGRYGRLSGTSMATPHVAGLAALALSANPNLTASQLRSLIVEGTDRTIAGSDSAGGINAALTVALAVAGQTSSATATAQAQAQSSSGSVSQRRFASRSVDDGSPADGIASVSSRTGNEVDSPLSEQLREVSLSPGYAIGAARDAALAAIDSAGDDWWTEPEGDDDIAFDETELCDLFAELAMA
jgi:hypothetical protein